LGYSPYYFKRDYEKQIEKMRDPSVTDEEHYSLSIHWRQKVNEQRKQMVDSRFQMMMKVVMQVTESSIGKFSGAQFAQNYTGNHVAVFECELKAPAQLAMIDHNLQEYMLAHRINFRNWRIVDFDNYMQGNSYFAKQQTIKEFTANVEKLTSKVTTIGTGEHAMEPLKDIVKEY
jgi:hypothetical protein